MLSHLRIVSVADEADVPDWVRRVNQEFADRYGVPYYTIDEALAQPDVDLVSVCSEPTRHTRLAIQAAEAGSHVLIDKPMATHATDAQAVAAAVERASRQLSSITSSTRRWNVPVS